MILILKSKSFPIPEFFTNISQTKREIFESLLTNKEYTITSNVSEDVLLSFINFWVNETTPNITSSNYLEYRQLGDEFQIKFINDFIQKQNITFDQHEAALINLSNASITLTVRQTYERIISQNLDTHLLLYRDKLMSLPIQTLFRIFSDPVTKLSQHELAYQAIVDHFKKHNDLSIFGLLSFLDGSKLNQESLEECIKETNSRCGFCPKLNYSSFEEKMTRKDAQITKLEQIVSSQQSIISNITNKLDEQVCENQENKNKINELQHTISLLKGEIINENKKTTNIIERLYQYHKDPEFISKYTNFFIPIGKTWQKLNLNHFVLKDQNKTYHVTASSTYSDSNTPAEVLTVDHLFNGKNEFESGLEWVSKFEGYQSIVVSFSVPVCVNVIWITVRNEN